MKSKNIEQLQRKIQEFNSLMDLPMESKIIEELQRV
jgi:hypothetical protein